MIPLVRSGPCLEYLEVAHRAARPRVRGEHEMMQCLDERPLVIDTFVPSRLGQPPSAGDGGRPKALHRVPRGAVVVGGLHRPNLGSLRVSALELSLDERGDVDVVHHDVADEP